MSFRGRRYYLQVRGIFQWKNTNYVLGYLSGLKVGFTNKEFMVPFFCWNRVGKNRNGVNQIDGV